MEYTKKWHNPACYTYTIYLNGYVIAMTIRYLSDYLQFVYNKSNPIPENSETGLLFS